jgi:hypothetical protein
MIFLAFFSPSGCCGGPHEKRLLGNLLDKYNTLERPVFNESEPVVVSFGLTLMQIIDVVRICHIYNKKATTLNSIGIETLYLCCLKLVGDFF